MFRSHWINPEFNECSAGFGNFAAVFLFPILIYNFGLGVTGAALSTVISQYELTPCLFFLLHLFNIAMEITKLCLNISGTLSQF